MILDLLNKRTSVRQFDHNKISESSIESILEAGRLSPSGGNEQPWQFGVVVNTERIHQIADLSYHQEWIKTAPLLIVLCTAIVSDERGGREIQKKRFPHYAEAIDALDHQLYTSLNMEEHQTKIPGTHMILKALEENIYSTWVSYFDVRAVSQFLNLPKDLIASEIIAFGYCHQTQNTRNKKTLEDLVFYDQF